MSLRRENLCGYVQGGPGGFRILGPTMPEGTMLEHGGFVYLEGSSREPVPQILSEAQGPRGAAMQRARQAVLESKGDTRIVVGRRCGTLDGGPIIEQIAGYQWEDEARDREEPPKPDLEPVVWAAQAAPESIREETFDGEPHWVIPIVAMVEGVHWASTSAHPTLWLADEFLNPAWAWDGRPVTFRHPEVEGQRVSANARDVSEVVELGRVFNAKASEDGKRLLVDLYVNVRKAEDAGDSFATVLSAIRSGDPIDVSVGAALQEIPARGTYGGEEYQAVVRNVKPDHIAILDIGEAGACSWADGCGAPRTADRRTETEDEPEGHMRHACDACTDRIQAVATALVNPKGPSLAVANMSDTDLRTAIEVALEREGAGPFQILAVTPDRNVVYMTFDGDRIVTLQRAFRLRENRVTLAEESVEVRPVTEFVPAQEATMKKTERIDALIAHEGTRFEESDRGWLEGLEESALEKLEPTDEGGSEEEPPSEPAALSREDIEARAKELGLTVHEGEPQTLSAEDRAILDSAKADRRKRHADLVESIVACERNVYEKPELESMDYEALQKLSRAMGADEPAPDYSGQGAPAHKPAEPGSGIEIGTLSEQTRAYREKTQAPA